MDTFISKERIEQAQTINDNGKFHKSHNNSVGIWKWEINYIVTNVNYHWNWYKRSTIRRKKIMIFNL